MEELLAHLNPAGLVARVLSRIDTIEHKVDAIRSEVMSEIQDLSSSVRAVHDELRALNAKVTEVAANIKAGNEKLLADLAEARAQHATDAEKMAAMEQIIADHVAEEQVAATELQQMAGEAHATTDEADTIDDPAAPPAT